MNAARRKAIADAVDQLQSALSTLETCRDEEREYYDNMPEGLQNSTKGEAASEAADMLDEVVSAVEEAISNCESIK